MDERRGKSVVVHDDTEFYVTVAMLQKPIRIKPYPSDGSGGIVLSEMECKALIVPPGEETNCQCCSGNFPPPYPFIVEESQD